jgi:hypothetical protein
VSNIYHLSKKDALKFIANLMSEEEAVGEVTSLATSKASRGGFSKKRKAIAPLPSEDEDEEHVDEGSVSDSVAVTE